MCNNCDINSLILKSTEPASEYHLSSSLPQPTEQEIVVEASTTPVLELCHTPEPCNVASTSHCVPASSNTERQRGITFLLLMFYSITLCLFQ